MMSAHAFVTLLVSVILSGVLNSNAEVIQGLDVDKPLDIIPLGQYESGHLVNGYDVVSGFKLEAETSIYDYFINATFSITRTRVRDYSSCAVQLRVNETVQGTTL